MYVASSCTPSTAGPSAERIICTPGHPFYVDGKGFVKAEDLGIGTSIVTRAGPALTLSATMWSAAPYSGNGLTLGSKPQSEEQGCRVYNFTVEDDHTYFVGTTGGGVWVHNTSRIVTPYGSEEYSAKAVKFRRMETLPEGKYNVAVFRVREAGGTVLRPFRSTYNIRHAEEEGIKALTEEGKLEHVEEVYSELKPCGPGLNNCAKTLRDKLPGVPVKFHHWSGTDLNRDVVRALGRR